MPSNRKQSSIRRRNRRAWVRGLRAGALGMALSFGSADALFAQTFVDPYGKVQQSEPGKWPTFYKPSPEDAKYDYMVANGYCKVGGWRWTEYYKTKEMDVNILPEAEFNGHLVTPTKAGQLAGRDDEGHAMGFIIHPLTAVSRVTVHGDGLLEALEPGRLVRFVANVDKQGHASEPLSRVELIAPGLVASEEAVVGSNRSLVGKIVRREGHELSVLLEKGKIRKLSLELTSDVRVTVNLADISLAAPGDGITARGRLWHPDDAPTTSALFASELTVTLSRPLGASPKKSLVKTASK
jgi:hypothetical protein